jgi:hypothetical protein
MPGKRHAVIETTTSGWFELGTPMRMAPSIIDSISQRPTARRSQLRFREMAEILLSMTDTRSARPLHLFMEAHIDITQRSIAASGSVA